RRSSDLAESVPLDPPRISSSSREMSAARNAKDATSRPESERANVTRTLSRRSSRTFSCGLMRPPIPLVLYTPCGNQTLHTHGTMPGGVPEVPPPPGCPQVWGETRRGGRVHHSRLVFKGCDSCVRFRAASIASAGSLLPRFWLHSLCASLVLLRSYGSPPRLTGTISSTSGDAGNPCLSFTSTNPPQSQQFVSSLNTCARNALRFAPLVCLGLLTASPSV